MIKFRRPTNLNVQPGLLPYHCVARRLNLRAIFISYRRSDSEGEAGRLFDALIDHFNDQSVFMDVDAIQPGRDFRRAIDENIAECSVLLAVIGQHWLESKDSSGQRRLDDSADSVRLEIASALRRDIPVVPVLVRGARMPHAEQLPPDLRDLAYRNAVELTHPRWKSDLQILLNALSPHLVHDATAAQHPWKQTAGSRTSSSDPSVVSAAGIEPATAASVAKELASYIGPIAEIVVKRAAKQSPSLAELCEAVAEEIESGTDRKNFLAACRRLK